MINPPNYKGRKLKPYLIKGKVVRQAHRPSRPLW